MIFRTPCSFYTFSQMIEVKEIIVVCDPSYKDVFEGYNPHSLALLVNALPLGLDMLYIFGVVMQETFKLIWLVMFSDAKHKIQKELKFTLPGKERQDSVYSGLQVHRDSLFSIVNQELNSLFHFVKASQLLPKPLYRNKIYLI